MGLLDLSVAELLTQLESRRISSVELVQASLARIREFDGSIHAFLSVDEAGALARAAEIDNRRASGAAVGQLAGVPIALKDILCTAGWKTTCASRMLANFVPPYDATVVSRLKAADAVLIGKVNLDEFAMGGSTENSAFQKTCNPWDRERTPGGSSGGSAASVAASMTPGAVGTDTGGSIRQPAAFCGITGLKPTYGRVSRYGLIAFASSLDQAGPLAWSARDVALLLETIAGHDPLDSTSADVPVPKYTAALDRPFVGNSAGHADKPLEGMRLGVVKEHFGAGLDSEIGAAVAEAVRVLQSLGARVQDVSLPHGKYGIATYYVIAPCEASSNLARYDGVHYGHRSDERGIAAELEAERALARASGGEAAEANVDSPLTRLYRNSRAEGFGAEVKRRIMLGTYALSAGYYDAYYVKALKVRRLIRADYDTAFRDVDVVLGPTTPTPAYRLGEKTDDPLAMYLEDLYTVTANLAGVPGLSLPCGLTKNGLPIGLQLQGPSFQEERLLQVAHRFQQATDWHQRRPVLS